MGKKLIIPGADFSANHVVIPIGKMEAGAVAPQYFKWNNTTNLEIHFNEDLEITSFERPDAITSLEDFIFGHSNNVLSIDLTGLDVSNITSLSKFIRSKTIAPFEYVKIEDLIIRGWDLRNVTNFAQCFYKANNLKRILFDNILFANSVTNCTLTSMFDGCSKLEELNLSFFKTIGNLSTVDSMFNDCNALKVIDFSNAKKSGTWYGGTSVVMFKSCSALQTIIVTNSNTSFKSFMLNVLANSGYLFDSTDDDGNHAEVSSAVKLKKVDSFTAVIKDNTEAWDTAYANAATWDGTQTSGNVKVTGCTNYYFTL